MSVFKRYKGVRITSAHPAFAKARWWTYKRLNGKVIHQAIPEAHTRREAEAAERQIIKGAFDHLWTYRYDHHNGPVHRGELTTLR